MVEIRTKKRNNIIKGVVNMLIVKFY